MRGGMQLENRSKSAPDTCSREPLCRFCRALTAGAVAAFGGGHRGWMLEVWGGSGWPLAFNGWPFCMTSCMRSEETMRCFRALKCIRVHDLCSQRVQTPIHAPGARPAHRCLASCASLTTSSECRVSFAWKTRRQERQASRHAHAPRAIAYTAGHFHQAGRPQ